MMYGVSGRPDQVVDFKVIVNLKREFWFPFRIYFSIGRLCRRPWKCMEVSLYLR